jgi:trichohyalin
MALSKIFKKTSAPDELPDLAIDELKKDLKKDYSEKEEKKSEEKKEEAPKQEKAEEITPKEEPEEEKENQDKTKEEDKEKIPSETEDKKDKKPEEKSTEEKVNLEKSFFNPLLDELKKENFDPAKINSWYQQKFSEKGAIEEMKEYWEKQKDEFITETIEKEFKERINEKMNHLQKLESEWQEIYISLIQKEEEMKKEEKNIKKIIKEFSEVFKKKGNLKKEPKAN